MMKRRAILTVLSAVLVLLMAACGDDETSPSLTSDIPPVVFFNETGGPETFTLEGTASDNLGVAEVLVAINGTDFYPATLDPPGGDNFVAWSYATTLSDLPVGDNTVLLKAIDENDNETVASPIDVKSTKGSTVDSLLAVLDPPLADNIGLSTGSGSAYGDAAEEWTIPIDAELTLFGAGSDTVLEAAPSHPRLFSVGADLTLRKMVIRGGQVGIEVFGPSDPVVLIEDCSFDGQGAWALKAVDDDEGAFIEFLSSSVDASSAYSSSMGGLFLDGVTYSVASDSRFTEHTDPGGPDDVADEGAAIQIVGGSGTITESLFKGNALAIWASGGSPVIDFCEILGATATTSYGINLTGESDAAVIRENTIDGNSGYGVRVGGSMTPKLRQNIISNNKLSGILIDFSGDSIDVQKIDLGKTSDFGNNDLYDNTHPGVTTGDTQLYVTSTTPSSVVPIPAEYNYWGVNEEIVESVIYHGSIYDSPGRATVDFFPAFSTEQN